MTNGISDTPPLCKHLLSRPFDFDFVQAVATLENSSNPVAETSAKSITARVGYDFAPRDETVRFRVAPTLRSFSAQVLEVAEIQNNDDEGDEHAVRPHGRARYELTVPFLGLIGPNGVLPRHYTQTVVGRLKQHDYAMRDFFDLFHHRIISMFFRASVKYRLPYVFQATAAELPARDDSITQLLRCLVGFGDSKLKRRLSISDDNFLFYGGHFSDTKPTAHSLARLASDFCGLPVEIKQFQFEWLYIEPEDQTQLSASAINQLGVNMVIGQRVASWQTRFRVCLGPVSWDEFLTFLPHSSRVQGLSELIRVYVGVSLDFDLQVAVRGEEIPPLILSEVQPARLGWTTWIFSQPSSAVVEDAVFDIGKF
jgi:type VI secretion system protein ImpH